MITQKELDQVANLYWKTRKNKYKDLWYQEVRRWANGKDTNNISTIVRRDSNTGKVRVVSSDGRIRVFGIRGRSQGSNS